MSRWMLLLISLFSLPAMAGVQCWVNGTVNMNFGNIAYRTPTDVWNSVPYACQTPWDASGATYHIRLCHFIQEDTSVSGWAPRSLRRWDGSLMRYDLYHDPARVQMTGPAGSSAPADSWVQNGPMNTPIPGQLTLYGRVPAGQGSLISGTYESHFGGGLLRWRWSSGANPVPTEEDCRTGSGGSGGGEVSYFLNIQASVQSACMIAAVTPLDFGVQTRRQSSPIRQMGQITVRCPVTASWVMTLDAGQHAQAGQRYMVNAQGNRVGYNLFQNAAFSQAWSGSGVSGAGRGLSEVSLVPVYGEVPVQPDMMPGDYSDTVTVTLTW